MLECIVSVRACLYACWLRACVVLAAEEVEASTECQHGGPGTTAAIMKRIPGLKKGLCVSQFEAFAAMNSYQLASSDLYWRMSQCLLLVICLFSSALGSPPSWLANRQRILLAHSNSAASARFRSAAASTSQNTDRSRFTLTHKAQVKLATAGHACIDHTVPRKTKRMTGG